MSSLRDIRTQLRSIENIKKITDAMERVAAARLRRAQIKAEQSRPYVSKLKEILENLSSTEASSPLFEQRTVKKTGVIIVAADRGLSGSYNTNLLTAADKFLNNYEPSQVELLLLGRKAIEYYHRKKWTVRHNRANWTSSISQHEIHLFSNQLVDWFLSGEFDELWLIYTHYISVARREVIVEKFLNIGKPQSQKKATINYIFEPNPQEILAEILPKYCMTRIQTALNEAVASELAARIMAMQTASKNSSEMIEDLTLVKNKMRQRDITREMIEISAGANQ